MPGSLCVRMGLTLFNVLIPKSNYFVNAFLRDSGNIRKAVILLLVLNDRIAQKFL
jgi:hypothetical protein